MEVVMVGRKPVKNPQCWLCGTPIPRSDVKRLQGACTSCNATRVMVYNIKRMSREKAKTRIDSLLESARIYQFVLDSPEDDSVTKITKKYVRRNL
jgi:hypothetical protein